MTDATAHRWTDDTGRVRWQPMLGNVRRWAVVERPRWRPAPPLPSTPPVLHRWRWVAVGRARLEGRRRARRFLPD